MTDQELAAALVPEDLDAGLRIVAVLKPEKRKAYERLIVVGREIDLWEAGLGPAPEGVIMTRARGRRSR